MQVSDRPGDPPIGGVDGHRSLTLHGALVGLLWLSFGAAVIRNLLTADEAVWGLTEWAINYEAGFVRRGLPGQLALMASREWGVSGLEVAVVVSLLSLVFLVGLSIAASRARILSWWAAPSAALLGGVAYATFMVRKDTLVLAILAICLWILAANGHLWLKFLFVNFLSIAGVLTHESYAVLALPALTIIGWNLVRRSAGDMGGKSLAQAAWAFPAWIAAALAAMNSRAPEGVDPLWRAWFESGARLGMLDESPSVITGAVDALRWDTSQALSLSGTVFTSPRAIIWILIAGTAYSLTWAAFARAARAEKTASLWPFTFRALLLTQVALSALLWISGWDYSRWIVMTCVSVALIWGWNLWCLRSSTSPTPTHPTRVRRLAPWVLPAVALVFATAGAGTWDVGTYIRGMPIMQIPLLAAEVMDISRASLPSWVP